MTAKSKWRGHGIESYDGAGWYYSDSGELVKLNPKRTCGHCNLPERDDECDPCLGKLPGVANACCGHGSPSESYIQFEGGLTVREFLIDA